MTRLYFGPPGGMKHNITSVVQALAYLGIASTAEQRASVLWRANAEEWPLFHAIHVVLETPCCHCAPCSKAKSAP